ncbi:MAG: ferrous iron transport protein B, partial [Spirochaetota bacterium]|nr:ferrous iron transport protein B [Spirochaetota bacterium]
HNLNITSERDIIYSRRREAVNDIVQRVVRDEDSIIPFSEKLGQWAIEPLRGGIILLFVLGFLYLIVGKLVAGELVDLTEKQIMQTYWTPFMKGLVGRIFDSANPFYTILAGEFGLLTMTITYIIGLLLPLVIAFYLMFALLEDSGYLPRLAALVDHFLTKIGLNGRAIIPLILGFGCVQLGTISTRLLGTTREKRITASLLNFTIPCSAQLGVITVMLSGSGIGAMHVLLYISVMFGLFVLIGVLLNRILPGESLPLLMDLPPMRWPDPINVLRKTLNRTYFFIKEASPWFFLGALMVTLLQVTGGLDLWKTAWGPLTESWLGLPKESATAFIMGMVRRDFGAAGLHSLNLDPFQTVVSLIVITLFVPCIASFMVLLKERGVREGMLIWVGALAISFTVGGTVYHIGSLF